MGYCNSLFKRYIKIIRDLIYTVKLQRMSLLKSIIYIVIIIMIMYIFIVKAIFLFLFFFLFIYLPAGKNDCSRWLLPHTCSSLYTKGPHCCSYNDQYYKPFFLQYSCNLPHPAVLGEQLEPMRQLVRIYHPRVQNSPESGILVESWFLDYSRN